MSEHDCNRFDAEFVAFKKTEIRVAPVKHTDSCNGLNGQTIMHKYKETIIKLHHHHIAHNHITDEKTFACKYETIVFYLGKTS